MRLPSLLRRTPFRLTLLFLALFAAAASAILGYVYVASAAEARARAESAVRAELDTLTGIYRERGSDALNRALVDRLITDSPFLYLLMDREGSVITGSLTASPIVDYAEGEQWITYPYTDTDAEGRVTRPQARGVQVRLASGELLFVARSMGDTEAYLARLTQALWAAMGIVLLLGLAGGLFVSRNLERSMGRLNRVVTAVQEGDLKARAPVRNSGDELDELGQGLNVMLDRLEASMASIRHAGDAIAHDLRSPLTRMRAKLEVALIDAEAGKIDGVDALQLALDETDSLLKTFNTVLAIARLQAAAGSGRTPDPTVFDAAELAADMAELYEPASEDKGLEFSAEIERGLMIEANRPFLAQALANIIDNAIKYTPTGGAVMLRARRRSSGEIEFSVTDTGPGVPEGDRERVIERFVRLDNSRTEPGSGLGLALVGAVMEAHGGRIQLDEGPGAYGGFGPGLRVALVLPPAVGA
ncbi:MAG: HAMP domain-containing histidine kinase [Brevundimonas sp.]|uniref:sensor histidine kinase n=1 Tax=Brevundimonas sp. TaxID=1871086 RepID=UPI0018343152|nr:HAMP domain-containing sensor histidine kinase [Brevundimonas sp.]MBA4805670.1 HAMP domain-containing histidine kinase [Brevundimonas sp.]